MENANVCAPRFMPPLDAQFRPPALAHQSYLASVSRSKHKEPLVFSLERPDGAVSRFETWVCSEKAEAFKSGLFHAERVLKFLLWQRGGWRVHVGGPRAVGDFIKSTYGKDGSRAFDSDFMGRQVYERDFEVVVCSPDKVPAEREVARPIGRNLQGCRIGFDLGASDRKVSAVVDGTAVFSEEVVWEPKKHSDPSYHYDEIVTALRTAAAKMPRLDAIGGSAAGVWVGNRPMVASLFRGVPAGEYPRLRGMFLKIAEEFGVPVEIVNDGDVTALAGSMSLEDNGVLGLAMGSSEAAGYVNLQGSIMGWLNELAFAPVDYNPAAPVEEWSKDRGCGASYFSQQCVFRLVQKAGLDVSPDLTDADRLKEVQHELEQGHPGAVRLWETMGTYLGYTLAHYFNFYELKHVLILGRCTSGSGGPLILDLARRVLATEFPSVHEKLKVHLPDEKFRRVGQSIVAASLPRI